ncbi:ribonuclease HI family protein [Variovorax sp. HJSM1_2]|uniref:ribonuclease HI family protein n=1 Tax=Variovorax sp. HJSM1_2 TaxID=3366263 RepID=UPI003BC634C6
MNDDQSMGPWVAYVDGSALPNPGRMGLGAVWTAPDGACHTLSQATHSIGCNNEAELRALMAVLRELQREGATAIVVHSDNSVVVQQVGGHTAKPIARLAALFDEARTLFQSFEDARLMWIPQHRNAEADALARAALGMGERVLKLPKKRRR